MSQFRPAKKRIEVSVGDSVRIIRELQGLGQNQLAQLSGIPPTDIELAVAEVQRAGGTVLRRGELAPGCPYVYVADPDGYEIEIWYE
jgi:predicted enzyme related to lactoylglutathione lyase